MNKAMLVLHAVSVSIPVTGKLHTKDLLLVEDLVNDWESGRVLGKNLFWVLLLIKSKTFHFKLYSIDIC